MKVKDFIDVVRPLTSVNPDSDIYVSFDNGILIFDVFFGKFHMSVSAKDVADKIDSELQK